MDDDTVVIVDLSELDREPDLCPNCGCDCSILGLHFRACDECGFADLG